jgi:2-dehydro-3-deoxygluconokinase
MSLEIPVAGSKAFDAVSLGEVMLRLDPGDGRIRRARSFDAWEGGGEYNAIRALSAVFGLRTAVLTSLVDNEIGRLVASLIGANGVDTSRILWRDHDGTGKTVRNALNFVERGFGVRGPLGVSDRANSATSQLSPGELDLPHLLADTRWLHTGGVFCALGAHTAEVASEAIDVARSLGVGTSFDTNFRPSLWPDRKQASRVLSRIASSVDVLFAGERDLTQLLGVDPVARDDFDALATATFNVMPQLSVLATTRRTEHAAGRHDWGASVAIRGLPTITLPGFRHLDVLDRIGGGDAFAAGLLWGLLTDRSIDEAVQAGVAAGALTMTTPGDGSQASLSEVLALAAGVAPTTVR